MNYWIFKISRESAYPDLPGRVYVYDNTHSVRVERGDEFLYLEKSRSSYGFTGAGCVSKVTSRSAEQEERHNARVDRVFTAHLADVVWFSELFDLSTNRKTGRLNRRAVGLPADLNSIGWSISMPRIERDLFLRLLDAALESGSSEAQAAAQPQNSDWRVDNSWSLVRRRRRMQQFRAAVLARHNHTCVVCGTQLPSVLDAAHIRNYAADPEHRANPANGICLRSFCHAAFDCGDVAILPDGRVEYLPYC